MFSYIEKGSTNLSLISLHRIKISEQTRHKMADSRSIQKARLSAIKAKTYVPCVSCLAFKRPCSASRPCSSCTSARKPCVRAAPVNASKLPSNIQHSAVDRPLRQHDTLSTASTKSHTLNISNCLDWARNQLLQSFCVGHAVQSFADTFLCLPMEYHTELNDTMRNARAVSVIHSPRFQNPPDETGTPTPNPLDEVQLLDVDSERSCFVAYFGTASRPTVRLLSTRTHAALFGFHREEFLARAASRELPMPFTEVDGLLDLLYRGVYNLFATGPPPDVYMRMAAGGGAAPRRGMLVCLHKEVLLDEHGRLREVPVSFSACSCKSHISVADMYACVWAAHQIRREFREIGADEYDEAVRRRPAQCVLYAMGDVRCGR